MRAIFVASLLANLSVACQSPFGRYCDEDTPCTQMDFPYCDQNGEFPASEGHGNVCIPSPFDAGATAADAGEDACVPATCDGVGAMCGEVPDECGGTLSCGTCTTPNTCGGSSVDNSCGCRPGAWTLETVTDGGYATSLALAPDGSAHLAFSTPLNPTLNYAFREQAGTWSAMLVDDAGAVGWGSSIAVAPGGDVHIGYVDVDTNSAKHAHRRSGEPGWTITTLQTGGVGDNGPVSLVMDSDDGLHASFVDVSTGTLRYANRPPGEAWDVVDVDAAGAIGGDSDLAIDGAGGLHVAYQTSAGGLKYAHLPAAGGWTTEAVDTEEPAGTAGFFPSVAVDSEGRIHIVYIHAYSGPSFRIRYASRPAAGAWATVTLDDVSDAEVGTSIALDADDGLHVAYMDKVSDSVSRLKYGYLASGGEWTLSTADPDGAAGYLPSLALDSQENPHVAHWDRAADKLEYAALCR